MLSSKRKAPIFAYTTATLEKKIEQRFKRVTKTLLLSEKDIPIKETSPE